MAIKQARYRATGDPGLLGALGGALKGGFNALVSGGNPLMGAIRGGVSGSGYRAPSQRAQPQRQPQMPQLVQQRSMPVQRTPGFTGLAQRFVPGGATGYQVTAPDAGAGCPSGYHLNKTGYYTHTEGYIAPKSKCVKNRRRNPANPRALDRALGRLDSAKRLQHKLSGYSTKKYTSSGQRKNKC